MNGFATATQSVYLNNPNATLTFGNDGDVINGFIIGITGFGLNFPDGKGHNVAQIQITLDDVSAGSASNVKNVKVTGVLSDKGGNTIDLPNSWVTVAGLAWLNTTPSSITLDNASAIANNGQSAQFELPSTSSAPAPFQAVMAGFNVAYSSGTDNQVEDVNASVGVGQSGNYGYITAVVGMYDNGGHTAATATANGGLLAIAPNTDSGLLVGVATNLQTNNLTSTVVDFSSQLAPGQTLGQAVAMLQAFNVHYESNNAHDINVITAGLMNKQANNTGGIPETASINSAGTGVTLPGPQACMFDLGSPTNHYEDGKVSYVNMIVFAVPTDIAS